jgi:hypothetical protein
VLRQLSPILPCWWSLPTPPTRPTCAPRPASATSKASRFPPHSAYVGSFPSGLSEMRSALAAEPPNSRLVLTVGGAARGVLHPPRLLPPPAADRNVGHM